MHAKITTLGGMHAEDDDHMVVLPKTLPPSYGAVRARSGAGLESVDLSDLMASMQLQPFHYRAMFFFAFAKGCIGAIYEMSPLVLKLVAAEFALDGPTVALSSTVVLGGAVFGSVIAAPLADLAGRWRIYTLGSTACFLFGTAQGLLLGPFRSYALLLTIRFLLGWSFGAVLAMSHAYLMEFLPQKRRGTVVACVGVGWQVGTMYCLLVAYLLPNSWRLCYALSAVPFAGVVLGLLLAIPESPRWLLLAGRVEQAKEVLQRYLGQDVQVSIEVTELPDPHVGDKFAGRVRLWCSEVKALFHHGIVETTVLIWILWMCIASSDYTLSIWQPTLLMHMLGLSRPPTTLLLARIVASMVSHLLLALVIDRIGRKPVVVASFGIGGVFLLAACATPSNMASSCLLIIGFLILDLAWTPIALISLEIFPTSCRVTAMGLCLLVVRVSAAVVPTVLGMYCFRPEGTNISMCLAAIAAFAWLGSGCGALLPKDTTDLKLQDVGFAECVKQGLSMSLSPEQWKRAPPSPRTPCEAS
mmetsp:Transcript_22501/g.41424  ORF Transcript_22501/g.41424 Transcript_22501/m.41424 type:complete len:528 (-) Transcript_22501:2-1585(-)